MMKSTEETITEARNLLKGMTSHALGVLFFFLCLDSPKWATASSLSKLHDRTQTHHNQWDSSGRVMGQTQRPLQKFTCVEGFCH